jgi:2-aminoadipate transaminase
VNPKEVTILEFENLLAGRTKKIGTNAIREILKVVSKPGMVSLAGGIPAPESFPMEILQDLTRTVFEKYAERAFQYDLTEGFPPLREVLVDFLNRHKNISARAEDILISSGSQGILDAVGKIFITKGDCIAIEAPTYIGAIQAFNPYEPTYIRMDTDDDGLIPGSLENALRGHPIKFIYLVPTFQNPSGRTIPLARRIEIASILRNTDALLIEDDPYSMLRYRGENIPSIQTLAPDHVLYVSTLSKVFAPGLRIGFCVAPEQIKRWLVIVKQGVDLHTSTLNQALAAEYLIGGHLEKHLPVILNNYGPKQKAMLDAFEVYFPESFSWSKPEGGMFLWAEGPKGLDMEKIYWKAVQRNIAFVPGKFFYTSPNEGIETMRLNYTMADEIAIDRSIRILSEVIVEEMHSSSARLGQALQNATP